MSLTDANTREAQRSPLTPPEIKAERLNRGYSLRDLAQEIHVPEKSIRRLENGLGVNPSNAKKIADFYGVKVTDLMPVEAAA
jgi:transcriptional regulator with XRE-family HTH domain